MHHTTKKVRSPFRKVLFASNFCTGYEGALLAAFQFCRTNNASLRILHVCRDFESAAGGSVRPVELSATHKGAAMQLRQMKERAIGMGLNCTTALETGVPAERILRAIAEEQIDLVVLGTSEPRGSKRLAFGPTAEQVMRESTCPIMTVGLVASDVMTTEEKAGPVVFATDFHSVTRKAIHLAVSYCKSAELQLHCLHVLPRTLQSAHGDHTLPEILTCALKHLVATTPVPIEDPVCRVTYGSEISNAVVDYVRQQRADLIFLGVRRDSIFSPDDPLPIVYRIITEAPCPVVTILCDAEADPDSATHPGTMKSQMPTSFLQ
ncbi:MAG: universal stress protein [Acidobacteriaceae bacterium]